MKTTIDIADHLLEAAKERAVRDRTTLRALVEDGLRHVLDDPREDAYRWEPPLAGDPGRPVDPDELARALAEARAGRGFPELGGR